MPEASQPRKPRMTKERFNELLEEWEASPETQKDFCVRKGINHPTFTYWRTQLNSQNKDTCHSAFARARIVGATPTMINNTRVILSSGVQIIIPANQVQSLLSSLFHTMGLT